VKPTVDRRHNGLGESQIIDDPARERRVWNIARQHPIILTAEQQRFVERTVPGLCQRGGWDLVECAAASNHVHVVLDADSQVHGKQVRPLVKRWLTQAMNEEWPGVGTWWAEGGSARAVRTEEYREAAKDYVARQRATSRET
jgi:REP element-mobilizing transposase RayT